MSFKDRERDTEKKGFCRNAGSGLTIYVAQDEDAAVMEAVRNFAEDWARVGDMAAECGGSAESADIVIGTVRNGFLFPEGMEERLKDENGALRWEGYCILVENGKMFILGADRRGAVFGIYEVSGQIGVSPWHYWADVPYKKKKTIFYPEGYCRADWPSVPYRGIFINDEEELEAWVKKRGGETTIGPATYSKIYELLLRLGGNSLWPAMHVNAFNKNSENGRLADKMGIVIGTSHCDMLLRNNNHEWDGWIREKGYADAVYDYSVPGENRRILQEYWKESVEQNREYEVSYTVGMRGIHDSPFQTREIDSMDISGEEKERQKKRLLEQIIKDQRAILKEIFGGESSPMQTFIPYKEVLPLYDSGLELPEDITLIWVDDNFGYMRRYPNQKELLRSGGHGLYYHASYWGHPNMSYLFVSSIPLAHTKHELQKAYEAGIRKLWIYNTGAIKPLEQDVEFFMRYAWEAGKETTTADVKKYLELWIDRNFTGGFGAETADILTEWAQLTNVRKLEHMSRNVFSQTVWGDEAGRRVRQYQRLFERVNRILESLPEEEREAFFELAAMKVHASLYINASFYFADRSELCIRQGKYRAANACVREVMRLERQKEKLIDYYNHRLKDGKWCGILTPEAFPPPSIPGDMSCMPVLWRAGKPDRRWSAAEQDAESRLGCILWGEENESDREELIFSGRNVQYKWIELFTKDMEAAAFRVEHSSWVWVSEERGSVETEKRIGICPKPAEDQYGTEGFVRVYDERERLIKRVRIRVKPKERETGCFLMTADGYMSVAAQAFHRQAGDGWRKIPYLGHGSGAVMENVYGGALEYDCLLERGGEYRLDIFRFPSLNSVGRIRAGVKLDDGELQIVESLSKDEWQHNWKQQVMNGVEILSMKLRVKESGRHTLKLIGIDPYFAFSGFVLYAGEKKNIRLMPPDGTAPQEDWELIRPDWKTLDDIAQNLYGSAAERNMEENRTVSGTETKWRGIDISGFGGTAFEEKDGGIMIAAAEALGNTQNAFCSGETPERRWNYGLTGKEDRVGLYLYLTGEQETEVCGPALHYRIRAEKSGNYRIWVCVRVKDGGEKVLSAALDGVAQPVGEQDHGGELWNFEGLQIFRWIALSSLWIGKGEHIFSIAAESAKFHISRIWLTGSNEPPRPQM